MYASQDGHVEVVNTLLQHGASVEMQDNVKLSGSLVILHVIIIIVHQLLKLSLGSS